MIGAAALTYLLFWMLNKNKFSEIDKKLKEQKKGFEKIDAEKRNLTAYSKILESERKNQESVISDLKKKMDFLNQRGNKLQDEKKFIVNEFNVFKKSIVDNQLENGKVDINTNIYKERLYAAEHKVENWKEKYFVLKQAHDENIQKIHLLQERTRGHEQKYGPSGASKAPDIDWQEKYDALKNEFELILKEKAQIIDRQKNDQLEMRQYYEKELLKVAHNDPNIQLPNQDDLQKISGIGPYVEQTLNAMGIFRYAQIAKLSADDISKISEETNIAPSRIINEDWIKQAKTLK